MGRSLRHDPDFGWHHVMNRGVARQAVFFSRADGERFESLLAAGHDRFGVETHAYCLMTNHFHLLLHCPTGGLPEFMQHLSACYTRFLNSRMGRDGPIFRGRYRSILVDSDRYLAAVGRYIHRNPLDLADRPELHDYRWSSYRCYLRPELAPRWLKLQTLGAGLSVDDMRLLVERPPDEPVAATVEWAIGVANAEQDDDRPPGPFERTVGCLMLDRGGPPLATALDAWLAFPSEAARRTALCRARRRAAEDPALNLIADRAVQLLVGVTSCV